MIPQSKRDSSAASRAAQTPREGKKHGTPLGMTSTALRFARGGSQGSRQACLPGTIYRAPTKKEKDQAIRGLKSLRPEGLSYGFLGAVVSCESDCSAGALVWRTAGYFISIHFSRPPSMIFTLV